MRSDTQPAPRIPRRAMPSKALAKRAASGKNKSAASKPKQKGFFEPWPFGVRSCSPPLCLRCQRRAHAWCLWLSRSDPCRFFRAGFLRCFCSRKSQGEGDDLFRRVGNVVCELVGMASQALLALFYRSIRVQHASLTQFLNGFRNQVKIHANVAWLAGCKWNGSILTIGHAQS